MQANGAGSVPSLVWNIVVSMNHELIFGWEKNDTEIISGKRCNKVDCS